MKTFKQFISEAEYNINKNELKEINKHLYDLVKKTDSFETTKDMLDSIILALEDYDLVILSKDNKTFSGKLLVNKGSKEFSLSNVNNVEQGRFIPFENLKLTVNWSITEDGINLKDVFIG
ncbi:hypothetical protein GW796_05595 [archaeon]|nr:hypothetical protein [archaeon]NCQ51358.1 hypothetical protein [archaeon]NCT58816.1 hypothetical protein [archaeon]